MGKWRRTKHAGTAAEAGRNRITEIRMKEFILQTENVSYAYEEGGVTFYAQVSGVVTDYDRTFRLEVFGKDSALVAPTVRTEDYVIPAGSVGGTYKVYFNTQKLANKDLFSESDGEVHFRVVPTDAFSIGTEKHQQFKVVLKNYLAKPANWDSANYPRVALSKYFGSYSRVKYQFMIEHIGLIDFDINFSSRVTNTSLTGATHRERWTSSLRITPWVAHSKFNKCDPSVSGVHLGINVSYLGLARLFRL